MRALPTTAAAAATAVLAATLTLGTAGVAGATGAARATPSSWQVPSRARITVEGHGYGHGHGMSQYGAEGAARQGLGYRRIVDFYYPGTAWGTSRGRVTVLITADSDGDVVVRPRPGLTVRDTAGGPRVPLPDNGARLWKVAPGSGGGDVVSFKTRRWHRFSSLRGRGELFAGGDPIALVTPDGTTAYRGRLRDAVTASGDRVTVNDLTLENYLLGVVPREMPASWDPDAVRAQAVAARTYAAYEREHPLSSAYQLCDTTSCQVYGGYVAEYPASNQAVADTGHQILRAGGKPAFTQFGSSSGGWTSAGSVGYLPAKRDPYDGWSGNPVHSWSEGLTDGALERAFPRVGDLRRIAVTRRDGHGDWGGRVRTLVLSGGRGRVTVSGDTFRSVLGLRSSWFTFQVARGTAARSSVPTGTTPAGMPVGTP
jgi:SpoIID/LytB domain protein